jgi:hypothetical protein
MGITKYREKVKNLPHKDPWPEPTLGFTIFLHHSLSDCSLSISASLSHTVCPLSRSAVLRVVWRNRRREEEEGKGKEKRKGRGAAAA